MSELNMEAERERVQRENTAFTEWWNREQACPEHNLITENAAHAAWQERARRTAPVSSPMGQELPPLPEPFMDLHSEPVRKAWAEQFRQGQHDAIVPYAERIRHLERELEMVSKVIATQEVAARPNEKIWALREKYGVERELAERKPVSIDSPEFRKLLNRYLHTLGTEHAEVQANIIAYIDGRSAGTAPEGKPVAWARKWHIDGEKPEKQRNANGRMAWPGKFRILPVTPNKAFPDDVPLIAAAPTPTNSGSEEA